MNTPSPLELQFHERMLQIYEEAKRECNYTASRFLNMVLSEGGLKAAKALLGTQFYSEGLTRLWEEKRLDISLEATVLSEPWCTLFTQEELDTARRKLQALGYATDNS